MYKCQICGRYDYNTRECGSFRSSVFGCNNWEPATDLPLFHGTDRRVLTPTYGFGSTAQDYGQGFYLTPYPELAKEWAVGYREVEQGYMHKYTVNLEGLKIYTFENNTLEALFAWISELMKYREADDTLQYRRIAQKFILKYGLDLSEYDVICGWRADSSFFRIAKDLMRGELSYDLLDEALHLGDFGIQVCIKSQEAFKRLIPDTNPVEVSQEYKLKYEERDTQASEALQMLEESERNNLEHNVPYLMQQLGR